MSQNVSHVRRRTKVLFAVAVAVVLVIAVIAAIAAYGLAGDGRYSARYSATAVATRLVQSDVGPPTSPAAAMIRHVLPSVVNVRVTQVAFDPTTGASEANAEGSGVIVSRDGVIVTNNHVVEGAVDVTVAFTNGRQSMRGTVVGTDPQHDLAVVKVDATGLTPIELGRSGNLELGDTTYAIGFPLGLGATVTRGIVSGLNRTVEVQGPEQTEHLVGLLQTDAAINPGNSGGALVDAAGQLVGINTAAAQAGAAENVGFAISVDEAVPVVREIFSKPLSEQAWLGVEAASVDSPSAAAALGLPPDARGAAIVGVVPDSPADSAGLRPGEVIVSIAGAPIASGADLTNALARFDPGQRMSVTVLTMQGQLTVDVELASRPPGL
jgi:S1-C subfamily serine protease